MDRRSFIKNAFAVTAAGQALCPPASAGPTSRSKNASSKTNFIVILADDLGYGELGCYGNTFNETPHLDSLSEKGVRFTDSYSSAPVCSPTRAALFTGQWPHQSGITDYLRPWTEKHVPLEKTLLPEAMKDAGYRTGLIGKWHLTGYGEEEGFPRHHGYDEIMVCEKKGIGNGDYFYPYRFNRDIEKRLPGKEHLVDRMNLEAVDFIERNRERPFFLMVSHYAVHTILHGRKDLVRKYKRKDGAGLTRFSGKNNPHLAAQLESIDQGVGMIMDSLADLGILDNTVVLFMSDNGGEESVANNGGLRAGKSHLYEGGIRVPMILGAGNNYRGTCETPASTIDIYPTILEMAGIDRDLPLEGSSLVPYLDGRGPVERTLYWHYPLKRPHFLGGRSSGAIRDGKWKLIEFYDPGKIELYDLESDPGETTDLSGVKPNLASSLHDQLGKWRRETGAVIPE